MITIMSIIHSAISFFRVTLKAESGCMINKGKSRNTLRQIQSKLLYPAVAHLLLGKAIT